MVEIAGGTGFVARTGLGTLHGQATKPLLESSGLRIVEEAFLSIYSLRQSRRLADHSSVDRWLRSQPLALPGLANGLSGSPELGCCWFEPNAWLLTALQPLGHADAIPGLLATNVSDRLAAFRLTGSSAREVIAAGCNPASLRNGHCVRTRFASFATVLLQQWDETDYRLLVDVSVARSFAGWLLETSGTIEPG